MKNNIYSSVIAIIVIIVTVGIFVIVCSMKSSTSYNENIFISIEKYIKDKKVTAEFKSLGGHQGDCIEMNIQNKTADTLFILLEPGRRLIATEHKYQDILIVKERKIHLSPYEERNVKVNGFCCISHNSSPKKDLKFKVGYMAPPEWIELANVINQNNFPADAVQHAVWVLSDNHKVASIYSKNVDAIKLLREAASRIKKVQYPWYYIIYEPDTTQLFSDRAILVKGEIDYYTTNTGTLKKHPYTDVWWYSDAAKRWFNDSDYLQFK